MSFKPTLTRRKFLCSAGALVLGGTVCDSVWFERYRLRVSSVPLAQNPTRRFVLWSDFHYSGDRHYADHVIDTINAAQPQFVCFVGDLVDQRKYQEEALEFVRKIRFPVYGVPGNHDYSCRTSFSLNRIAFAATGGAWLVNQSARPPGTDLELCGSAERFVGFIPQFGAHPRILLTHYPMTARETNGKSFNGILAGHSHGGQVRIPFYGALVLPRHVGRYEMGLFNSPAGPLYVTQGVGTYKFPARFNCPPEIAVIEV